MTLSDFDKRVLIEQIRYMETQQALSCDSEQQLLEHSEHHDFAGRLWQRAQCLVAQHNLSALLGRAPRLARYTRVFALLVAALLGVLGTVYAITDSHSVNIYWLLLVLLGFNFISMLLWLVGSSLNMQALSAGTLARLTYWLPGWLQGRGETKTNNNTADKPGAEADRAWLACHYSAALGKWQFSKMSHQLWLVYLCAGLLCLVLLLMVRQVDFVWGTTLLSDQAFIQLTDVLGAPLQAMGFATPTPEQVAQSRIGAAVTLTAEHRLHWAQFLLGALLCFGIAPRIVLLAGSALMYANARRRFELDYYLPYYISLRQRLMPLASHGQVVDADTSPPLIAETPAARSSIPAVPGTFPAETQWVAVETGDDIHWPPQSINPANDLGRVLDRESLAAVVKRLQKISNPVIAVAVSSARAPDRGVQRSVNSLMSNSAQRWLVLLQHDAELISTQRLAAWYRLAEACKVPADHVISLSVA